MDDKERYKRILSFFTSLLLMTGLVGAFAYVWYHNYSGLRGVDGTAILSYYRKGHWVVIGIYAVIMMLFMKVYGSYRVWYLKVEDALYSQIISIFCANFIEYFQISLIGKDFMPVIPMVWLTVFDLAFSIVWTFACSKMYRKIYPPRRMIMVHDGSLNAQVLTEKMSLRTDKYMICKAVSISTGYENVLKEVEEFDSVIICDIDHNIKSKLLKHCFSKHKRAYITPSISDIITRGADDVTLFDTPLILSRNKGLSFEQNLLKRIFDIVVSAIALIPLSIVMLFCAIAIKLEDGGSVFYKQVRLTKDGKEFEIIKFRSMVENAEEQGIQLATDNDSRITKVGKVLRKYRLDEIPQLINILKGDMSIIGPRPERPELTEEYEKTMPEFGFRLHVKAGLTGYAQVTGKYDTTPYDKLKMDLMYIENYSALLDLRIIFMTIKIILFPVKTNAEELGE